MQEIINFFITKMSTLRVWGLENSTYYALAVVAIVYILIKKKEGYIWTLALLWCIMFLILYFPVTAYLIDLGLGEEIHWRSLWMLPNIMLIGYMATEYIADRQTVVRQLTAFGGLAVMLFMISRSPYTKEYFQRAENMFKIPNEAIEVADIMLEEDYVKAVVPLSISAYMRQYDPQIQLLYSRDGFSNSEQWLAHYILDSEQNGTISEDSWSIHLRDYKYNFFVIERGSGLDITLTNIGFTEWDQTSNYIIYHREVEEP